MHLGGGGVQLETDSFICDMTNTSHSALVKFSEINTFNFFSNLAEQFLFNLFTNNTLLDDLRPKLFDHFCTSDANGLSHLKRC